MVIFLSYYIEIKIMCVFQLPHFVGCLWGCSRIKGSKLTPLNNYKLGGVNSHVAPSYAYVFT